MDSCPRGAATRVRLAAILALLSVPGLAADRHKLDVDPESDDGILLQRIRQEPTAPRKLALLEKYAAEYPNTVSIAWVYEQMLPLYAAGAGDSGKVLATAEKLLAIDPQDLDSLNYALRAVESKSDSEATARYAKLAWDASSRAVRTPKPTDPYDVPDWKGQMDFARDLLTYSEYTLYSLSAHSPNQQTKSLLIHELEIRNPHSKYLGTAKSDYAHAGQVRTSGEISVSTAEKGLVDDPDNEDFLLTVAEYHMGRESEFGKVLAYSQRVIHIMQQKAKPEGLSSDAWEQKRRQYLGAANWMAGVVNAKQGRYALSDRYLRSALPYLRDRSLQAAAWYYLGYDNYALGSELRDGAHLQEAVKFNKLCLTVSGPFQPLAQKNLDVIRSEFNVQ
jgi:tetratricopeptide (TPR) repeat protein